MNAPHPPTIVEKKANVEENFNKTRQGKNPQKA